jgi:hypothetical protein
MTADLFLPRKELVRFGNNISVEAWHYPKFYLPLQRKNFIKGIGQPYVSIEGLLI